MKGEGIILGRKGFSTPHRREGSSRQRYAEMGIKLVRNINNAFYTKYEKKCFELDAE